MEGGEGRGGGQFAQLLGVLNRLSSPCSVRLTHEGEPIDEKKKNTQPMGHLRVEDLLFVCLLLFLLFPDLGTVK